MADEHVVLYRQYRPQTFDEVVGQDMPVSALRHAVMTGKLAHSYLFCGQHGTGKTTIAKILARAVNCESPHNGNPCNECPCCKSILAGSNLDIVEMDAASNNGVDDIRPIVSDVNFAATTARKKVYIIDEVHMLSKGAFNALLKTIEEPPKNVIFIFATTELEKIPSTIVSRCQKFDFKRIPVNLMMERLRSICNDTGIKISDDALRLVAARSDGALRDALSLLDQVSVVFNNGEPITTKEIEQITGTVDTPFLCRMANALLDGRTDEIIDLAQEINDSGKNQSRFALDLAYYFRDLYVVKVKANPSMYLPYSEEDVVAMYQTAAKATLNTLKAFVETLSDLSSKLSRSSNAALDMEVYLMGLSGKKVCLTPSAIPIPGAMQNNPVNNIDRNL